MFRTLTIGFVGLLALFSTVFSAELLVNPLYSDPRFPPTDRLHAGCMQTADINLATELDIKEINVVLQFDPEKIDILRILPDNKNRDEVIDFDIRYGEIEYRHANMVYNPWYEIKIFSMMFNSRRDIDTVDFIFAEGSYAVTQGGQQVPLDGLVSIPFANVPECDPDIIPPSVNLVKPAPTNSGIALDSLFVFEIRDIGKGVDQDSVYVLIGQEAYTINTPGVAFSGDFLVIQPRTRLPVAAEIEVRVAVSDLQVFGGPNRTEKTFIVNTAEGVVLDDNINPMELRQRAREMRQQQGSLAECELLQSLQGFIAEANRDKIQAMALKLECDLVLTIASEFDGIDGMHGASPFALPQDDEKLSLFAVTGWILFFVTLLLKLHYFVCYKEHKKQLDAMES